MKNPEEVCNATDLAEYTSEFLLLLLSVIERPMEGTETAVDRFIELRREAAKIRDYFSL